MLPKEGESRKGWEEKRSVKWFYFKNHEDIFENFQFVFATGLRKALYVYETTGQILTERKVLRTAQRWKLDLPNFFFFMFLYF